MSIITELEHELVMRAIKRREKQRKRAVSE